MKDIKIDDSAYKAFIDGKLQTSLLFVDGQESFEHGSIAVFTANSMPNVKIDTGTARRIRSLTHIATFTSNKNDVDESKHIYLKDINFMEQFEEEEMKLAWFQNLGQICVNARYDLSQPLPLIDLGRSRLLINTLAHNTIKTRMVVRL
jgi:hypothetical protein